MNEFEEKIKKISEAGEESAKLLEEVALTHPAEACLGTILSLILFTAVETLEFMHRIELEVTHHINNERLRNG